MASCINTKRRPGVLDLLDSHPKSWEGGEAARPDLCEVEHQGGHPVTSGVGVTALGLY